MLILAHEYTMAKAIRQAQPHIVKFEVLLILKYMIKQQYKHEKIQIATTQKQH